MLRTAKKLFKTKKRKRRSGQDIYLEKQIRKIKVKNPATGRVNSLWNFRILSKKALRKMTPAHRKAFGKLHKEYKKQEARALKRYRKQHGLSKKQTEHTKTLPSHLVKRHNLLVKQHGKVKFDMGEGPVSAKDLLKRWKDDPEEYAKVVKKLDAHHKKERGRLIKEHGDAPVTAPDGSTKTVKEALQEALKTGNRDLYTRAIKATKSFDKFAAKERKMEPKQVASTANRFRKLIKDTIGKVDAALGTAKEKATTDEDKQQVEQVSKDWEAQRKNFAKALSEAKAAVAELQKKKEEVVEKAKSGNEEARRESHEKALEDLATNLKDDLRDVDRSDDSDEEKAKRKKELVDEVKKKKAKLWEEFKEAEEESGDKGKKKKKGKGLILTGLFKTLAGAKKALQFTWRAIPKSADATPTTTPAEIVDDALTYMDYLTSTTND